MEKYAVVIGAILVFIVGILNVFILIKHNRKSTFVNYITQERIRYLIELRAKISDFCTLMQEENYCNQESNKLKNGIFLLLNPEYEDWDYYIMEQIKRIINTKDVDERILHIDKLILKSQFLFKLEWDGIQHEAINGNLNNKKKIELSQLNLDKYSKHDGKNK